MPLYIRQYHRNKLVGPCDHLLFHYCENRFGSFFILSIGAEMTSITFLDIEMDTFFQFSGIFKVPLRSFKHIQRFT